jgi:para-aminobenzoate synthetase component 1
MTHPDGANLLVRDVERLPRERDGRIDVARTHAALAPADLLESAPSAGWTYVVPDLGAAGHPDLLRLVDDGATTHADHADGRREELGTDPLHALDVVSERHGVHPDAVRPAGLPALTGGLVGAFAYDLARRIARLPSVARSDRELPLLALRLVGLVVAIDADRTRALVVVRPGLVVGDPASALRLVLDRLAAGVGLAPATPPPPVPAAVTTSLPRERHLAAIEEVLERIAAGDCYQVNLAQRLTGHWRGDLVALGRALVAESPASHAALLPGLGIASISPESFLEVDGRHVTTRPIKGTRPRARDGELDAALADDLATSVKDRAENVMVVDLERNDLGRVCRPGSVVVDELARVEEHPTVWHLVSTVRGELADGVGWGRLFAATFPSGSITGAPKLAAMRIIEELEPVRRGWYCGAIGFLAPGAARLSVAIRTATLQRDGTVDYGAGGGIVADSDPDAEVAESLDKAAAFLRAIAATHVVSDAPAGGGRREGSTPASTRIPGGAASTTDPARSRPAGRG